MTPLVDGMLVLLIVFMVSAPLLTVGVPVDLPETEAGAMGEQTEPLAVSVRADGAIFIGEEETTFEALGPRLAAVAQTTPDRAIYVRADGRAPYARVAQVMARLQAAGLSSVGLITDTGPVAPASPAEAAPSPEEP